MVILTHLRQKCRSGPTRRRGDAQALYASFRPSQATELVPGAVRAAPASWTSCDGRHDMRTAGMIMDAHDPLNKAAKGGEEWSETDDHTGCLRDMTAMA